MNHSILSQVLIFENNKHFYTEREKQIIRSDFYKKIDLILGKDLRRAQDD